MTQNIITTEEIREGDRIKVTVPRLPDEDREVSLVYTGTAHQLSGQHWETEKGWLLYTDSDNAVIELLDRPKPRIKVPTSTHSQVTYSRVGGYRDLERFAVLTPNGKWKCYDSAGEWQDTKDSEAMDRLLNSELVSNVKVLFEGVAK